MNQGMSLFNFSRTPNNQGFRPQLFLEEVNEATEDDKTTNFFPLTGKNTTNFNNNIDQEDELQGTIINSHQPNQEEDYLHQTMQSSKQTQPEERHHRLLNEEQQCIERDPTQEFREDSHIDQEGDPIKLIQGVMPEIDFKGMWVDERRNIGIAIKEGTSSEDIQVQTWQGSNDKTIWEEIAMRKEDSGLSINCLQVQLTRSFMLILARYQQGLIISSLTIESLFSKHPPEPTLVLGLGDSDVLDFSFNEKSASIYLNFSNKVLARKDFLDESNILHPVFDVPHAIILSFGVFDIQRDDTLVAILYSKFGDHQNIKLQLIISNNEVQSQTDLPISLSGDTSLFLHDHEHLIVSGPSSYLILKLNLHDLSVTSFKGPIQTSKPLVPLTLISSKNQCQTVSCTFLQKIETPKSSSVVSQRRRQHGTRKTMTANFEQFLKEQQSNHQRAVSCIDDTPVNGQGHQTHLRQKSSLLITQLQDKTNKMNEKLKRAEAAITSRKKEQNKKGILTRLFTLVKRANGRFFFRSLQQITRKAEGQHLSVQFMQRSLGKALTRVTGTAFSRLMLQNWTAQRKEKETRKRRVRILKSMALKALKTFQGHQKRIRLGLSTLIKSRALYKLREEGLKKGFAAFQDYLLFPRDDFEAEEGLQKRQLTSKQNTQVLAKLSLSLIGATPQQDQHQEDEDKALFQRLFDKYHQEVIERQLKKDQEEETKSIPPPHPAPSSSTQERNQGQGVERRKDQLGEIYEYFRVNTLDQNKPYQGKGLSIDCSTITPGGYFNIIDGAQSISVSNIEERVNDQQDNEQDTQLKLDNLIAQEIQSHLGGGGLGTDRDKGEKKDFSFSIELDRGVALPPSMIIGGASGTASRKGHEEIQMHKRSSTTDATIGRRPQSIVISRNYHHHKNLDPATGFMIMSHKQQREKAAMNELNAILNERITLGMTQRERKRPFPEILGTGIAGQPIYHGYYETLGIASQHYRNQATVIGFNPSLEQETANFNRDDWINGTQQRSASSKSNNPIRGETKNSLNSRQSTLHQQTYITDPLRQTGLQLQPVLLPEEGKEIEDKIESSPTNTKQLSPNKMQFDPSQQNALQEFYRQRGNIVMDGESELFLQDSFIIQQMDLQSPIVGNGAGSGNLMQHSHYANFSQDFICPDEQHIQLDKRSKKYPSGMKLITTSQHENSGATTPAQHSAFEMFRTKLNTNLQNLRSHSQSRITISDNNQFDFGGEIGGSSMNCNSRKNHHQYFHQKSRSYSQSISNNEYQKNDTGFSSNRISLHYQVPLQRQTDFQNIQQSPIKCGEEGIASREFFAGNASASVYQQLAGLVEDYPDEEEKGGEMKYVEPFTQRGSLTNLELAEPMECGVQSSINDSLLLQSQKDQRYVIRESPQRSPMKNLHNYPLNVAEAAKGFILDDPVALGEDQDQIASSIEYQGTFGQVYDPHQLVKPRLSEHEPLHLRSAEGVETYVLTASSQEEQEQEELLIDDHQSVGYQPSNLPITSGQGSSTYSQHLISRNIQQVDAFKSFEALRGLSGWPSLQTFQGITDRGKQSDKKKKVLSVTGGGPVQTLSSSDSLGNLQAERSKNLKFQSMFGNFSKPPQGKFNEVRAQQVNGNKSLSAAGGGYQSPPASSSSFHKGGGGSVTFGQNHTSQGVYFTQERQFNTNSSGIMGGYEMIHELPDEGDSQQIILEQQLSQVKPTITGHPVFIIPPRSTKQNQQTFSVSRNNKHQYIQEPFLSLQTIEISPKKEPLIGDNNDQIHSAAITFRSTDHHEMTPAGGPTSPQIRTLQQIPNKLQMSLGGSSGSLKGSLLRSNSSKASIVLFDVRRNTAHDGSTKSATTNNLKLNDRTKGSLTRPSNHNKSKSSKQEHQIVPKVRKAIQNK